MDGMFELLAVVDFELELDADCFTADCCGSKIAEV